MEALIHHFKLYTEGFHVPAGEVYWRPKAPRANSASTSVSDGANKPYRCKIRPTAFSHLQAMDFMSEGHMLPDATAILGAIDVVFGSVTGSTRTLLPIQRIGSLVAFVGIVLTSFTMLDGLRP